LRSIHDTVFDPEDMRARQEEDQKRLEQLERAKDDGPIARLIRENEPITIYDCVVPWSPEEAAAPPPEDTPMSEDAAVPPPEDAAPTSDAASTAFNPAPDNVAVDEPDFADQ
jgi:hypothetical protein